MAKEINHLILVIFLKVKAIELPEDIEINLDHVVNKSQWIAAVVYCDNKAVAHTHQCMW
jgi:hypothetical protein